MEFGDLGTDCIRDHAVVLPDSQKGSTKEPQTQIHHCKPDRCRTVGSDKNRMADEGGELIVGSDSEYG